MEETSTSAPEPQPHRTTSGSVLLPEPRIPCLPALGNLSPHKMCTLRSKAPKTDPVLLGAPRFQVGSGPPRASAAIGSADSQQFRGGYGREPTGVMFQGGSGFARSPPLPQYMGRGVDLQDSRLGTIQSKATRVPQAGPVRPGLSAAQEELGTGMVGGQ